MNCRKGGTVKVILHLCGWFPSSRRFRSVFLFTLYKKIRSFLPDYLCAGGTGQKKRDPVRESADRGSAFTITTKPESLLPSEGRAGSSLPLQASHTHYSL